MVNGATLETGVTAGQLDAYVQKAGDTMTGELVILNPEAISKFKIGDQQGSESYISMQSGNTANVANITLWANPSIEAGVFVSNGSTANITLSTYGDSYVATNFGFGVGTQTPAHKLDVAGNINTSGVFMVNGATLNPVSKSGDTMTGPLVVQGNSATIDDVVINSGGASGVTPYSIAIGYNDILSQNTSGDYNIAIGQTVLYYNTTGGYNIAIGSSTLYNNISGGSNIAIGSDALGGNTGGNNNVAIGNSSLLNCKTASNNVAIGINAAGGVTGNRNVCIGVGAGQNLSDSANNTIIGSIFGSSSLNGTIILGAGTTERMRIDSSGNMGIGTTTPGSKLAVPGLPEYADNSAAITGGLTAGDFYRTSTGVVMVTY